MKVGTGVKVSVAVVALIAAGVTSALHYQREAQSGEAGLKAWFFDESEQRLYTVPRDTLPPHDGVGGTPGDGVRAVVVACRGECANADTRRIAYLETYTPEFKGTLERVRAARTTGDYDVTPGQFTDKGRVLASTLVRRPGETRWHPMSSNEGNAITTDWQQWKCPDGQAYVVCTP